jgi:hypothetical protein
VSSGRDFLFAQASHFRFNRPPPAGPKRLGSSAAIDNFFFFAVPESAVYE